MGLDLLPDVSEGTQIERFLRLDAVEQKPRSSFLFLHAGFEIWEDEKFLRPRFRVQCVVDHFMRWDGLRYLITWYILVLLSSPCIQVLAQTFRSAFSGVAF